MRNRLIRFSLMSILFFSSAFGQSGGTFVITESVVAGGGGHNASGGAVSIDGTIGQPAAGNALSNAPFIITSGFWNFSPTGPTAATVSVGGRISTPNGNGIRNVIITLTDISGGATRSALSSSFGFYRIDDVAAGGTYIVTVRSKRYSFAPQVVRVMDDVVDLNFVAEP